MYTFTTVASTAPTDQTWIDWSASYYASSETSSGAIWSEWNNTITVTGVTETDAGLTWQVWNGYLVTAAGLSVQPRELTAEEQAEQTERLRVAGERARAEQEAARAAFERAEVLLRAHLDAEQEAMLERDKAFLVSVSSGRRYRIERGQRGNVKELDTRGRVLRSFCIHPDNVPDQDAMLAQKLLLETDEAAFRRIANITERQVA